MLLLFALLHLSLSDTAVPCQIRFSSTVSSSYTVMQCLFDSLSSTYGGALYFYEPTDNATITKTLFSSCTSSSSGGAIYFYGSNISLQQSCFVECATSTPGQALIVTLPSSGSFSAYQTSYCLCSNSSGTDYTVYGLYGKLHTSNCINYSFNKVTRWGCSQLFQYCTATPVTFINLINGTAGSRIAFYFVSVTLGNLSFSNIIGNSAIGCVSFCYSPVKVWTWNCIFAQNTGSPLFYMEDSSSGSYVFSNCWISHNGTIAASGITTTSCYIGTTATYDYGWSVFSISSETCYLPMSYDSTTTFTTSCCSQIFSAKIALVSILCFSLI